MTSLATRFAQADTVGRRARLARELAGLWLHQVPALGVLTYEEAAAIELGKVKPHRSQLIYMAEAYGVCVAWLRDGAALPALPMRYGRLTVADQADVAALLAMLGVDPRNQAKEAAP